MMKVCKSDCEGTVAGTRGNGEIAPIPDLRVITIRPQGPTFNGHSAQRQRVIGSPGSGSSDMSV
jgi:hypothetical protein